MNFRKYHGLGNDYFVIHPSSFDLERDSNRIQRICDRHCGAGSDGILLGPLESDKAEFGLRIFNPDGSEAQKSGNGLRIFARSLFDDGLVQEDVPFSVDTLGGLVQCTILDAGKQVKVDMGSVTFKNTALPATGPEREMINETLEVGDTTLTICGVSVGNPHCVVLKDTAPEKSEADSLGPLIENHSSFPERTNVQFMHAVDKHTIQIEIWERGAGYTLASGSSSTASAAAAVKLGLCESPVTVLMPGGSLDIEFPDAESAIMTGPVQAICHGQILPEAFDA